VAQQRSAVVIGGGIAGLSAALRLAESGARVTLIEGSARLGGKLLTVDGREAGAENFLMRDPAGGPSAAAGLATELGLEIVHPSGLPAALFLDGKLKPLPGGTILGIPGPQTDLTGVATVSGADVDAGKPVLAPGTDVAVGELVRERLGDDLVRKLVDPLLGRRLRGLGRSAFPCRDDARRAQAAAERAHARRRRGQSHAPHRRRPRLRHRRGWTVAARRLRGVPAW
jgi:oxygen-dependent protoporphyrinogen oxidase